MTKVVRLYNRLTELMAKKGRLEGRTISQREIAETVGVDKNTINSLAHNRQSFINRDLAEKLMTYFNVDHTEFFETVVVEEEDDEVSVVAVA